MRKHIPNLLTLLNLLAGIIAVIFAVEGYLIPAGILVLLGIFFDFFDGFVARLLGVQGELGKQLDSLADVVTSGVVPGIVMFQLLKTSIGGWDGISLMPSIFLQEGYSFLPFLGFVISLASAYRLANFNIDTRQSSSFIGVPTPANTIFVISLPFILSYGSNDFINDIILNKWFLIAVTLIGSYLMNADIPLFSLKFKDYSLKNNGIKYSFLGLSVLMIVLLQFVAVPLIIILYVLLSLLENSKKANSN
ncbi:CDP-alcohol phosphatidyltransferase family protein [Urechidicola vernalis]|uniref:CDP-alcohol phosphatidyltransferase family protein n=1 Tax=Urechidicola vernalis TaxID=3075600 RepID=A0ABU2Y2J1_9FLAO|nr:CDP-alcohol phosphatidyltransferase family protein [Urechidicola sp. P050]MDT0552252.1 CDP-alcohol phosphatidyltransferase family protein [Urechidicola sp. P050]